jgi:hypothetical protein
MRFYHQKWWFTTRQMLRTVDTPDAIRWEWEEGYISWWQLPHGDCCKQLPYGNPFEAVKDNDRRISTGTPQINPKSSMKFWYDHIWSSINKPSGPFWGTRIVGFTRKVLDPDLSISRSGWPRAFLGPDEGRRIPGARIPAAIGCRGRWLGPRIHRKLLWFRRGINQRLTHSDFQIVDYHIILENYSIFGNYYGLASGKLTILENHQILV